MSLVIASYGGGTNSTAMLIECAKRGIKVDLILFADTGGEKPHIIEYVKSFSRWLVKHDMPEIVWVKTPNENLEQNCMRRNCLPAIAYGWKTCSQRFKMDPQAKYVNNWEPAKKEWGEGRKIQRLIGFDADEPQRADAILTEKEARKYNNWYPLIEWDMGRDECLDTIKDAGLCLPGKSACFFCPNNKPSEIRWMSHNYPELIERALAMERQAELTVVKGLGRNFAWRDLLAQSEIFDEEYSNTPEMLCGCYDG